MATVSYFSIVDFIAIFFWVTILFIVAQIKFQKNKHLAHYRFYLWNVGAKVFGGFALALVYTQYYEGGDTTAYWNGGVALHNLFLDNPLAYLDEMWKIRSSKLDGAINFSGLVPPPSWIYAEAQGYFVCKVSSILSMLAFQSYYAGSIIMGAITAFCSWRFFEFVLKKDVIHPKFIAFACLFVPSTVFWCSGISKDSLILNAIFILLVNLNLSNGNGNKISSRIWLLISIFFIFKIRAFILVATLAPIFLAINVQLTKKLKSSQLSLGFFRIFSVLGLIGFLAIYFGTNWLGAFSINGLLDEMKVIHGDFTGNSLYTGRRYDIGIIDYSNIGLLNSFPNALLASVFRPFVWEVFADGSNPFMLLNGIESILIFYMLFKFLSSKNLKQRLKSIFSSDLLLFSLFFVLIIGFFVGYTSVLFGVLVRLKAPILPFVVLIFGVQRKINTSKTL